MVDSGHAKVDQQLMRLVHSMHMAEKVVPQSAAIALARHAPTSAAIVKKLHARGAVSFEVVDGKEVHIATYGSDGAVKSYVELTLRGGQLGEDDMATVRQSMAEDFGVAIDTPAPAAKPAAKVAPKVEAAPKVETAPAPPSDDSEPVPGLSEGASGGAAASGASEGDLHAHSDRSGGSMHVGAALGFGTMARELDTGPMTIKGFTSTPVPSIGFEGHFLPTPRIRLAVAGESTLVMHAAMNDGSLASSSMSRWEGTAGYTVTSGTVAIAPTVGFGSRSFAIDSTDTSRSPDSNYSYLMVGVNAATPVGEKLTLRGNAFFEPAVGGAQTTTMTLGDASRWALDVGASLEMRFTHVFARAGIDWQRWSWTWDAAGATDNYFSGIVSLGADY
jgi:hypothetical protein